MSYGDVRDVIAALPHVHHGYALTGNHVTEGPPYALYPARRLAADCLSKRGEFRVFEFGTKNAYALCAMPPHSTVGWCDDESEEAASNQKALANLESISMAMAGFVEGRYEWPWVFRSADLVLVDGDHSRTGVRADLGQAWLMNPKLVLMDDVIPEHQPVLDAISDYNLHAFRVPTVNGLAVVRGPRMRTATFLNLKRRFMVEGYETEWL